MSSRTVSIGKLVSTWMSKQTPETTKGQFRHKCQGVDCYRITFATMFSLLLPIVFFFSSHYFYYCFSAGYFCYCFIFLVLQCEECRLEGYIYLVPGHGHHLEQNHCNDVPLMLFDCDGIVPVQYYFERGCSAITTSGRRINNIDLTCQGYEDEIDGERIAIIVEAKFLPYSGR